ncbi:hypothetical protein O0L34_g14086 [Tuta absoluta]|nr:hypothetical protein O0L34_g14086 [Tuta absoluta]
MIVSAGFFVVFCFAFIEAKLWHINCNHVRQFVDGHNSRRLLVAQGRVPNQPPADAMFSVVWDEELATKAAKWAAQNKFDHNPNRNIPSNKFRTGENLYIYSTTKKDYKFKLDDALEAWFEEHKHYKYRAMSMRDFMGEEVGHYTQMVWSRTVYIGCAVSEFREGPWNKFLVVCNYGPSGNVLTQKPYEAGKGKNSLFCKPDTCSQPYGSKCSNNRAQSLNRI